MTPVRKYLGAAVVAAALLGASACGASGGSDNADKTTTTAAKADDTTTTTEAETTTTTEARTTTTEDDSSDESIQNWAEGFCGGFGTWLTDIKAAGNSVGSASTPDEAKQKLVDLFTTVGTDTDTLISTVKDLPAPDIEDGDELNDDFIAKFSKFGDAIDAAKAKIEAVDPGSPSFKTEAQSAITSFQTEVQTVGSSFGELDVKYPDPTFQAALKSECAGVIGG